MLTTSVCVLLFLAVPAWTQEKAELWSGQILAKAEQGSIVIGGRHVRPRNRVTPKVTVMLSSANDNQRFTLWIEAPVQRDGDDLCLNVGHDWWSSNGTGGDGQRTVTSFQFDRTTAWRVAAMLGIPVHERRKLDDGLRYSWRFPVEAKTNKKEAIPVVLRVDNAGKTTVGFLIGGRQRGPRDNQFVFTIARNGQPVTIKGAPDFGGLASYKEMRPGEHVEVTCPDLRAWADLDLPGHYTIEARYAGELVKDGKWPNTAVGRANVWDIVATGQGAILVR